MIENNGITFLVMRDELLTGQLLVSITPGVARSDFPRFVDLDNDVDQTSAADVTACFLAGTAIATPGGTTRIEALRIGDLVRTADGRALPVRWIGRQTVLTMFDTAERLRPVRIVAGALGAGLPLRDLVLTADHALLLGGCLINAGALVNGEGIDWVPLSEFGGSYTVYHIETEAHDILLAEGAFAETYVDYVARRSFANCAEYVALYGEDCAIPELPYPRLSAARQVPPGLLQRVSRSA